MFHAIAERTVRQMFQSLSARDYEAALHGHARQFEHVFAGDHALGGTRQTVEGLQAWFERLYRLFPNLDFEVGSVSVGGPPWDMIVAAEWIDRATPAGGGTYENWGVHIVRLTWGKLASIHAYLDTQVLAESLRGMAANGIAEALALPITDAASSEVGSRFTRRAARKGARRVRTALPASGSASLGAIALGAVAVGAAAVGALAIGRLAIGNLSVRRARIGRLEIDELVVRQRPG